MWAIPGGKVDPGEKPIEALKREFIEEALNHCNGKLIIPVKIEFSIGKNFCLQT